MIGTTVGKYRIVGHLGRGATGIVYKAVDETLDREVAIKVLNPDLADSEVIKRFRTEATTLAKLNHPEIATIYELLHTDGELLMVMELVRGETLEQVSQRLGPIPPDRAAQVVAKILSALDHAHRAGIVHRDMKPANVMVTESGHVKVMDFGIARVRGAEHMTRDGFSVGTPAYMSPEQVLGEDVDGRADLYSVGVIFYRLLTGRLPFDADTPMAMLKRQVADLPAALHVHRADLPEWCEVIVERALAKMPDDRFPTAEDFRAALADAAGPGNTIDTVKALAVTAGESAESGADSGGWQTLPISRTAVASAAEHRAPDRRWPTAWFARIGLPDVTPLVHRAKQVARHWEVPLLVVAALVGMLAYSALGGEGISPIVADAAPPATFHAKALVGSGRRERDVTVLVGDGRITVTDETPPSAPLYAIAYGRVVSVTYSRSVHPMTKSPKGNVPVARSAGGTLGQFGIFVARHWIVLQTDTDTEFVVLRVEEEQARRVLTTIAERTGRTADTIIAR
jgi:tRNA A-37 threonylcarbamoyl transferase component Bud32